jgi:uncharacterized membrane protein YedE/YeeE
VLIVEAPDTNHRRSTIRALEAFAAWADLRTRAVLMGFGAVLAGGCTVGAGMTGGSIFSLTAWLTLIAIWLGAGLSWRIHRSMGWQI